MLKAIPAFNDILVLIQHYCLKTILNILLFFPPFFQEMFYYSNRQQMVRSEILIQDSVYKYPTTSSMPSSTNE